MLKPLVAKTLNTEEPLPSVTKLHVQGVTKIFHIERRHPLEVIRPIDMMVAQGEFVTLIGPSGCGKSTLLNIIAGVDEPSSGRISLDGKSTVQRRGNVGYMLQQPLLLPWRTVEENVLLGLDIRHVPRKQAREEARVLLLRFGLEEFAEYSPATLSGGMRQRVALLRTVLFHPQFLLLDEPFGALDALTRLSAQLWLSNLCQTLRASVVFITHDVREAILLSDRIYVLSHRPATILRILDVPLPQPREHGMLNSTQAMDLEQEVLSLLLQEQAI